MQLFTKNIWRKAKYYVILQPIKNIFKIMLSSVTTQSSKNRVHVFKGGLKVSSPLKSNLR